VHVYVGGNAKDWKLRYRHMSKQRQTDVGSICGLTFRGAHIVVSATAYEIFFLKKYEIHIFF
jgi:hypothetical protein